MAHVAAIILAAGESSRFGKPKQLAQFRGCTLLERTVRAAKEGGCATVVVVTGSDQMQVAGILDDELVVIKENRAWRDGIGTSVRAGVQHLIETAPETAAVVLMVCDQPFVSAEIVRGLIEKWLGSGKSIVASRYSNTLGVPALFDSSCFKELLQLEDDAGAKRIILADPNRVAELPFSEGACDIDTLSDYQTFTQRGGT